MVAFAHPLSISMKSPKDSSIRGADRLKSVKPQQKNCYSLLVYQLPARGLSSIERHFMKKRTLLEICRLTTANFIGLCLIASVGFAALVWGKGVLFGVGITAASNSAQPLIQKAATPEPLIVEQLTLRPSGFYPFEFTRPSGKFLLAVNNRVGIVEMNLRLSRETSNGVLRNLSEVKVHRRQSDWNDVVDLQPGTYLLTEASNPKWVCRITVVQK